MSVTKKLREKQRESTASAKPSIFEGMSEEELLDCLNHLSEDLVELFEMNPKQLLHNFLLKREEEQQGSQADQSLKLQIRSMIEENEVYNCTESGHTFKTDGLLRHE